jgi:hypothetical protein
MVEIEDPGAVMMDRFVVYALLFFLPKSPLILLAHVQYICM